MVIGVDMGGTHTRIGMVSEDHRLSYPCRIVKSRTFAWSEDPVRELAGILSSYLEECVSKGGIERQAVQCAAISAPASVSADFCTIYEAPNLKNEAGEPVLNGVALGKELETYLGIPVYVNKDVNYLLYYDMMANDLKGIVAGCYIGTGLGSAVSIHGKMLYGTHGFAMDCGHLPMYHVNSICGCGKAGCAETVSSGIVLGRIRDTYYPDTPFEELFTVHGNERVLTEFVRDCAYVPATLMTVFDPDALVLGGGVLEMKDFPRKLLEEEICSLTEKAISASSPRFYYAERLPERGVIGAALFAQEYCGRDLQGKK